MKNAEATNTTEAAAVAEQGAPVAPEKAPSKKGSSQKKSAPKGQKAAKGAKTKIQWPWFIAFFCLSAVCNTYLPAGMPAYGFLSKLAKIGLTATLYLIGSGISIATLKEVGHRPLLQGIALWLLVSVVSLWLIRVGWIAL